MAKRAKKRAVAAAESSSRTTLYLVVGAVAVGVVGLAVLLILNMRGEGPIRGLVTFPRLARDHDNTLVFAASELPPAGGPHYDTWANCGIYDEPVDTGHALHSLEHGAVWMTYPPDLPADEVAVLQGVAEPEPYVLLSPYEGQRSTVVMTAWGLQLELDSVNDDRIGDFIEQYQLGPQTPERGATCRDGAGVPMN
ncbi:MAG: DUF3105 domain-containing protein [Anaerolineales bacterium]|nr:DUF3105 domain-containing protein [Anaerolineales bacterium]